MQHGNVAHEHLLHLWRAQGGDGTARLRAPQGWLAEGEEEVTLSVYSLRTFLQLNFGWDIYDWQPDDIVF